MQTGNHNTTCGGTAGNIAPYVYTQGPADNELLLQQQLRKCHTSLGKSKHGCETQLPWRLWRLLLALLGTLPWLLTLSLLNVSSNFVRFSMLPSEAQNPA